MGNYLFGSIAKEEVVDMVEDEVKKEEKPLLNPAEREYLERKEKRRERKEHMKAMRKRLKKKKKKKQKKNFS